MNVRARVLASSYAALFGWACSSAAIDSGATAGADGGAWIADGGRVSDAVAAADAHAAGDANAGNDGNDAQACLAVSACSTPACADDPDAAYGVDCAWSCGFPAPCGVAGFQQIGNGCSSSGCGPGTDASLSYAVDMEAAKCVISALRDGSRVHVEWGERDNDIFNSAYHELIDVVAGRRAYVSYSISSDSPGYGRYAGRLLKPASYFQSCLDAGTADAYVACLHGAFDTSCP